MNVFERVVICIPTFKRPISLTRLLDSISLLKTDFKFQVLVADNDGLKKDGFELVNKYKKNSSFELNTFVVHKQGISYVRNELMLIAFEKYNADFIAMVDDDETVDSNWLQALIDMKHETGADAVTGIIYPEFPFEPPKWTNNNNLYWRRSDLNGLIPLIQGTGAVLLSRSFWTKNKDLMFDHAFGLTGGEDKEFFMRMKEKGATFACSKNAISYEYYGEERITKKWALDRAYRIGSADTRIQLQRISRLKLVPKVISSYIYSMLKLGVFFIFLRNNMLLKQNYYRQLGKLNALFGNPPESYKNTDGC